MLYQVPPPPQGSGDRIVTEFSRLIQHVGRLLITTVHLGPRPPRHLTAQQVTIIEVPDDLQEMLELRILPFIYDNNVSSIKEIDPIKPRPEWTHQAQLRPTADAQPLDYSVFTEWDSVCLTLDWRHKNCRGILRYGDHDVERLAQIRELGWIVTPLPKYLIHARLGSFATSLQPTLGPTAPNIAPEAIDASITTSVQPSDALLVSESTVLLPGMIFAEAGAPGLLIGTTPDGSGMRLAWRAQQLAVVAPIDRQRMAVQALVERGFQNGMGVIAVIPRGVADAGTFASWSTRMRVLDGSNQWQSAALPWRSIPRAALAGALAQVGISQPLPEVLPEDFGELLHRLDATPFCTEAVLGLTALPGDDLPGVVTARGGVILITDDDQESNLLAALLLAVFSEPGSVSGPILLIRPPQIRVPTALMNQAIQLVLGPSAAAIATLHAESEGWRVEPGDGSSPLPLLKDLSAEPSTLDDSTHTTIISTLGGGNPETSVSQYSQPPMVTSFAADPTFTAPTNDMDSGYSNTWALDPFGDSLGGSMATSSVLDADAAWLAPDASQSLDDAAALPVGDELQPGGEEAAGTREQESEPAVATGLDTAFTWESLNSALDQTLETGSIVPLTTPETYDLADDQARADAPSAASSDESVSNGHAISDDVASVDWFGGWNPGAPTQAAAPIATTDDQDAWVMDSANIVGDGWGMGGDHLFDDTLIAPIVAPGEAETFMGSQSLVAPLDEGETALPAAVLANDPLAAAAPDHTFDDDRRNVPAAVATAAGALDEAQVGAPTRIKRERRMSTFRKPGREQWRKLKRRWNLEQRVQADALDLKEQADLHDAPITPISEGAADLVMPEHVPSALNPQETPSDWAWLAEAPLLDFRSTDTGLTGFGDSDHHMPGQTFPLDDPDQDDQMGDHQLVNTEPLLVSGLLNHDQDLDANTGALHILAQAVAEHDQGDLDRDQGGDQSNIDDTNTGVLDWPTDLKLFDLDGRSDTTGPSGWLATSEGATDETEYDAGLSDPFPLVEVSTLDTIEAPDHGMSETPWTEDQLLGDGWGLGDDERSSFLSASDDQALLPLPEASDLGLSNVSSAEQITAVLSNDVPLSDLGQSGGEAAGAMDMDGDVDIPLISDTGLESGSAIEPAATLITEEICIAPMPGPGFPMLNAQTPLASGAPAWQGEPLARLDMPGHAQDVASRMFTIQLDSASIWAAWQAGTNFATIVQQCAAEYPYVDLAELRKVVRELLATLRKTEGPPAGLRLLFEAMVPGSAVAIAVPPSAADHMLAVPAPAPAQEQAPAEHPVLSATSDDDAIWAAWNRNMEMAEMQIALCGYARGVQADAAKQRIYHVVIPRIVNDVQAEAIVERLLGNRKLLQAQSELYELLLRRLNRQTYNVTGFVREKTEDRLRAVMRAVREAEPVVA